MGPLAIQSKTSHANILHRILLTRFTKDNLTVQRIEPHFESVVAEAD